MSRSVALTTDDFAGEREGVTYSTGQATSCAGQTSSRPRIIERALETQGYGRVLPVRPAPRGSHPSRCLRNHDLAVAGAGSTYHHLYGLDELTCNVCYALRDPLACWCVVDPAVQFTEAEAPRDRLAIVRVPPAVPRGGIGRLHLHIEGNSVGEVGVAVCRPCRRAVLERVQVDEQYRRLGFGRVLVAAALALAAPSEYHWSTATFDHTDIVARAFCAGIGWPGSVARPDHCSDMERAAGRLPDW